MTTIKDINCILRLLQQTGHTMPEFKLPGHIESVDFDYFTFEGHGFNHDIARELCTVLMAYTNIDDLHGFNNVEGVYYDSAVGTGGSMNFKCESVGIQRACLASLFASYSQRQYHTCSLTIYEYRCMRDLLNYLEEDYWPAEHRVALVDQNIRVLKECCNEFERAYVRVEPGFLFDIIKEAT